MLKLTGIGIDIVEIPRLKKVITKWGNSFLNRVFTDKEIGYCNGKFFPYQHFAARFAAKEAVIKALGKTLINFKDIEITNDKFGKPFCKIRNRKKRIHISITHTKKYAVASAII